MIGAGTFIGSRYRLHKSLGAGGMGEVRMATDKISGGWVAVKLLRQKHAADQRAVARFQREIEIIGSLKHENICEILDSGTHLDGTPFFVMPLLRGQSLADRLKKVSAGKKKRFSYEDIVEPTREILSALGAAHQSKIIHRDLKPSNVFLAKEQGRKYFVKLLDFGVSKILSQESTKLTETGAAIGTPHYMAPEQALGVRSIDHRVDIYSVGAILYEALTGVRPFKDSSSDEARAQLISPRPFDTPRSIDPSVPPQLEGITLKAMSRDPEDRYADANAMSRALGGFLQPDKEKTLSDFSATSKDTTEWIPMRKRIEGG